MYCAVIVVSYRVVSRRIASALCFVLGEGRADREKTSRGTRKVAKCGRQFIVKDGCVISWCDAFGLKGSGMLLRDMMWRVGNDVVVCIVFCVVVCSCCCVCVCVCD